MERRGKREVLCVADWNFQAAAIPAPQQAAAWAHANGNGAARA